MSEIALPKIDNLILDRKSEIIKNLSKLTNIENVLSEADELRPYETDALSVYTQTPLAVVLPENTDEVSEILKYCYSENIKVVPNALDKVQALNGVTFDWKKDNTPSAGVIAQDVIEVLPEAVKEVTPAKGGESHLAVNYHALTSILIESIKELKAEVEELKGAK